MKNRYSRALVASTLVTLLALTGCGSGEKKPASSAAGPDTSEPSSSTAQQGPTVPTSCEGMFAVELEDVVVHPDFDSAIAPGQDRSDAEALRCDWSSAQVSYEFAMAVSDPDAPRLLTFDDFADAYLGHGLHPMQITRSRSGDFAGMVSVKNGTGYQITYYSPSNLITRTWTAEVDAGALDAFVEEGDYNDGNEEDIRWTAWFDLEKLVAENCSQLLGAGMGLAYGG